MQGTRAGYQPVDYYQQNSMYWTIFNKIYFNLKMSCNEREVTYSRAKIHTTDLTCVIPSTWLGSFAWPVHAALLFAFNRVYACMHV